MMYLRAVVRANMFSLFPLKFIPGEVQRRIYQSGGEKEFGTSVRVRMQGMIVLRIPRESVVHRV